MGLDKFLITDIQRITRLIYPVRQHRVGVLRTFFWIEQLPYRQTVLITFAATFRQNPFDIEPWAASDRVIWAACLPSKISPVEIKQQNPIDTSLRQASAATRKP